MLHRVSGDDRLLIFRPESSAELKAPRGHRAIGVVYRPQFEQYGNYVPTVLPRRYDAFLYIDRTTALKPLFPSMMDEVEEETPETFPTGV